MKSFWSYQKLYLALSKESSAKNNLNQLKQLSLKAFVWLMIVEAVIIAQIYPTKYFIDGLTNGKPFGYLLQVSAVILVIYMAGSLLY